MSSELAPSLQGASIRSSGRSADGRPGRHGSIGREAGSLSHGDRLGLGRVPIARRADARFIEVEEAEPLREECVAFLRAVVQRTQPLTDGRSGLAVLRVLDAGQRSLETGGTPVRLVEPARTSWWAHPTASVDDGAQIGPGTRVWHYSHVSAESHVGEGCTLGQNVFVGRGARIGNGVKIQNNVSCMRASSSRTTCLRALRRIHECHQPAERGGP